MNGIDNRICLALLVGSTREGRFAPTVANWITGRINARAEMDLDVIDLADVTLPARLARERGPEVASLGRRLAGADAFLIVTPEYNHSFPAPLKAAIDWFNREWQAKPVAFVSYGGRSGGMRAVEQLRSVFAELHGMTVRDTVSFHDAWEEFDGKGQLRRPERYERTAQRMLDQLVWWGRMLREAKAIRPYPV